MARGVRNKKVKRNRSVKRKTRGAVQTERDIQKTSYRLRKALNNEPVMPPNHSKNMRESAMRGEYKPATRKDLNIAAEDLNEQAREMSTPPDGVDSLVRERRISKYNALQPGVPSKGSSRNLKEEKPCGENPLSDKDPLKMQGEGMDVAMEPEESDGADEGETVDIKEYMTRKITQNKRKLNYREKRRLEKAEFYATATPHLGSYS